MYIQTVFQEYYSPMHREDIRQCIAVVFDEYHDFFDSASACGLKRKKKKREIEEDALLALWEKNSKYADLPINEGKQ